MRRLSLGLAIAVALALAVTVQSAPSKPMGTLNVPKGLSLELKVDGKPVKVPTGKDVPVVAATYAPASLTCGAVLATAGKQELWTIEATGPTWGKLKDIVVTEGATTTLDGGPPFAMKTLMYKTEATPTGKVVQFTARIYGKAGELYDLNTFKRGMLQAPMLALQIVDEKGTVLNTGTLPYG